MQSHCDWEGENCTGARRTSHGETLCVCPMGQMPRRAALSGPSVLLRMTWNPKITKGLVRIIAGRRLEADYFAQGAGSAFLQLRDDVAAVVLPRVGLQEPDYDQFKERQREKYRGNRRGVDQLQFHDLESTLGGNLLNVLRGIDGINRGKNVSLMPAFKHSDDLVFKELRHGRGHFVLIVAEVGCVKD